MRQAEGTIEEEFPVVKSLPTEEGGKGGRLTEVGRAVAAKMLTDGLAVLASAEEAEAHRARANEALKKEEQKRKVADVRFTVLSDEDLRSLQKTARTSRKE